MITGGTRGIGLGIATELAKSGCNLALNGVRPKDQISEVVEKLQSLGADVIYCAGNISVQKDRETIVSSAADHFGQLHVLINNAGVAPENRNDILETTEDSFDRVMNINLKGTFFLTQLIAHHMIECRSVSSNFFGCIVNISSISATVASANRGEYCISKAGLSMMTQLFASRMGEYQIPVYEVRPGIIETDMTAGVLDKYTQLIEEGLFVQSRLGTPEDVGKVVSVLVEGKFPYSTGQVVMVDGGLTIPRL